MSTATQIANALRPFAPEGKLKADEIPHIDAIAALWDKRKPGQSGPAWLAVAWSLIGTAEIKGPKHNSFISKGWARLGAGWFNDDETPWCGLFVAHCIDAAGLQYPRKGGEFARAKSWLQWGQSCAPQLGAVVVFGRDGGGHVGFLVGESDQAYYVLGGNQKDSVNVTPFNKVTRRPLGFRWPLAMRPGGVALPAMSGGVSSTRES